MQIHKIMRVYTHTHYTHTDTRPYTHRETTAYIHIDITYPTLYYLHHYANIIIILLTVPI